MTVTRSRVRTLAGFIATFENSEGDTVTRHRIGPAPQALTDLCDSMARLDPSYRLVSYSSPDTIVADLKGGKAGPTKRRRQLPELSVLSQIGRLEMLHPRLRRADDSR